MVGRIAEWNDGKGYGFVTPNGGGERAFVHVKSFEKRGRRPVDGDLISYEPVADERQRLNATQVRHVLVRADNGDHGRPWLPRRTVGAVALLAIAFAAWGNRIPMVVALIYLGMSLIAFFAYGLDKSAALIKAQRTQESVLHLLELLGGWPGALIAQGSFRHKTRKRSYQVTFWLVVAINLALLAWLIQSGHMQSVVQQLQRFW